jgi:hypothetical protein
MEFPSDDLSTPTTKYENDELIKDFSGLKKTTRILPVSSHHREGMKLLEHFQPHFWETESAAGQSIAKNWTDTALMEKAIERTKKHYKKIYKSEIRRNLAFFSKAPLPTMYRPSITKSIVQKYNASKVLDCCVGWGGRMIGTLSLPNTHYTGIEPYSKTFYGLLNIANFIKTNRATLIHAPAERILPTLPSNHYDLVITSPPYFTLEVYTHESSQSVKTYPKWNDWVNEFLDPLIRECLRTLTQTGISAWSVKNMKLYDLQDEVFRIHEKYGFHHFATEGMTAPRRNQGEKAIITEETFLFRK